MTFFRSGELSYESWRNMALQFLKTSTNTDGKDFNMEEAMEATNNLNSEIKRRRQSKCTFFLLLTNLDFELTSGCEVNDSIIDLTDLDDIEKLEDLLRRKKEQRILIETKYQPIIQFTVESIEENKLDYRLVLKLLKNHYEVQK